LEDGRASQRLVDAVFDPADARPESRIPSRADDAGPRVVVIGDIGWSTLYHVGDEAMTEVALDALRERGVEDVVLVAGEPLVAEALYGKKSIGRAGFGPRWPRTRLVTRLRELTDALDRGLAGLPPDAPLRDIADAVESADAVLIAGGGNLNST